MTSSRAAPNGTAAAIALSLLFASPFPVHAEDGASRDTRAAGPTAPDPWELLARATRAMDETDYGRALTLLAELEAVVFPDGPPPQRAAALSAKGRAHWALGRYRDALEDYRRQLALVEEAGDRTEVAGARYNIALLTARLWAAGESDLAVYRSALDRAATAAVEAGHRPIEVKVRLLLGQQLEGEPALREIERARALARAIGDGGSARQAARLLTSLGWQSGAFGDAEALNRLEDVIREARQGGDLPDVARGHIVRAWLLHETRDRPEWIAGYEAALEAVERIRDLQPEDEVRARVFTPWAFLYYRFAGRLLDGLGESDAPAADLALAFETIERMRGRVLLESLDRAGVRHAPPPAARPVLSRRDATLREIVAVQSTLMNPSLDTADRASGLVHLEELEATERGLRDEIARLDPSWRLATSGSAGLAEIRAELDTREALLSFHYSSAEGRGSGRTYEGGGWVVAVTRGGVRVYPLAEVVSLPDRVRVYIGLLHRRDGAEEAAAAGLFADLLAPALGDLAPSVDRLVIVPDGALWQLPFAALRPARGGDAVGQRFELAVVPSATLWLRLRRQDDGPRAARGALTLADPRLVAALPDGSARSGDPWVEGLRLGALPGAGREARAVVRSLGGRMLEGAEATEAAVKEASLDTFGAIHFAAHAVVDDERPERSAVVLAPGDDDEDGLLQMREIARLPLAGQVVILSGCRSAAGSTLAGEGVLGLARAFFQAGASAVVASVLPLRDDEAEALVRELALGLARGETLSAAMRQARRERLEADAPPAAWAGLCVLGDGTRVVAPGGRPGRAGPAVVVAAGALLLVLVVLLVRRARAPQEMPGG